MRNLFVKSLYKYINQSYYKRIYILTGDMGYKMWDKYFKDFPDKIINCGASEQAMMGMAVGLALQGKIPFVYSITNFLLYRPFETIRNYINYEKIPVRLIGSGRDKDYKHDGISHWSEDYSQVLDCLPNIAKYCPMKTKEIPDIVSKMVLRNEPSFVSLKR